MDGTWLHWALLVAAGLHLVFFLAEMFPWHMPMLLSKVIKKHNAKAPTTDQLQFSAPRERALVSTIVHNAAIYNLIIALGFLWAANPNAVSSLSLDPHGARAIRIFFASGAILAGLFGLTISPVTLVQAATGLICLVLAISVG